MATESTKAQTQNPQQSKATGTFRAKTVLTKERKRLSVKCRKHIN